MSEQSSLTRCFCRTLSYLNNYPHIIANEIDWTNYIVTLESMQSEQTESDLEVSSACWMIRHGVKESIDQIQNENEELHFANDAKGGWLRYIVHHLQQLEWERYCVHFSSFLSHEQIVAKRYWAGGSDVPQHVVDHLIL